MNPGKRLHHCLPFILFSLFAAACKPAHAPTHTDTSYAVLEGKVMAIAEAIPIIKEDIPDFLEGLFIPSDSAALNAASAYYEVECNDYVIHFALSPDSNIHAATILPKADQQLAIDLKMIAARLDGPWKDQAPMTIPVKAPVPALVGIYADSAGAKKEIQVRGINLSAKEPHRPISDITISVLP